MDVYVVFFNDGKQIQGVYSNIDSAFEKAEKLKLNDKGRDYSPYVEIWELIED